MIDVAMRQEEMAECQVVLVEVTDYGLPLGFIIATRVDKYRLVRIMADVAIRLEGIESERLDGQGIDSEIGGGMVSTC